MKELIYIVLITSWIAGIVLAKGFWLTTLSIVLPFYAWYLLAEKLMIFIGIL